MTSPYVAKLSVFLLQSYARDFSTLLENSGLNSWIYAALTASFVITGFSYQFAPVNTLDAVFGMSAEKGLEDVYLWQLIGGGIATCIAPIAFTQRVGSATLICAMCICAMCICSICISAMCVCAICISAICMSAHVRLWPPPMGAMQHTATVSMTTYAWHFHVYCAKHAMWSVSSRGVAYGHACKTSAFVKSSHEF